VGPFAAIAGFVGGLRRARRLPAWRIDMHKVIDLQITPDMPRVLAA
jgi:hypothetical protein